MAEFAPAILDRLEELDDWLTEVNLNAMLKALATDFVPLQLLHRALDLQDDLEDLGLKEQIVEALQLVLKNSPPRLFGTYDEILERA